jgi:SpoVK/Ycf46/Vps4 family AAA+-type ATPase
MNAGDLGLSPSEVEEKLQQIFRLAQAWNCVMLLDEADIFLAQRTATDTERNALVSGTRYSVECVL